MPKYPDTEVHALERSRMFLTHEVTDDQEERIDDLRNGFTNLAQLIHTSTPDCREQRLALQYLEIAAFFSIAAIARREQ